MAIRRFVLFNEKPKGKQAIAEWEKYIERCQNEGVIFVSTRGELRELEKVRELRRKAIPVFTSNKNKEDLIEEFEGEWRQALVLSRREMSERLKRQLLAVTEVTIIDRYAMSGNQQKAMNEILKIIAESCSSQLKLILHCMWECQSCKGLPCNIGKNYYSCGCGYGDSNESKINSDMEQRITRVRNYFTHVTRNKERFYLSVELHAYHNFSELFHERYLKLEYRLSDKSKRSDCFSFGHGVQIFSGRPADALDSISRIQLSDLKKVEEALISSKKNGYAKFEFKQTQDPDLSKLSL